MAPDMIPAPDKPRKPRGAQKPDGTAAPVPALITVLIDEPEPDTLRTIGGSRSDKFNNAIITSVVKSGWFPPGQSDEDRDRQIFVAVTGLRAFKPADEIEALLVAQAVAMHNASMECSRRAMLAEQSAEIAHAFRKAAANASRTFIELLAALDRKRGRGAQQSFRVEHVHVNPGAQAIIGNVGPGGGGGEQETQGKPRVSPPGLANDTAACAVLSPLRRQDEEREAVPRRGHAERKVQVPRRKKHRPPDG